MAEEKLNELLDADKQCDADKSRDADNILDFLIDLEMGKVESVNLSKTILLLQVVIVMLNICGQIFSNFDSFYFIVYDRVGWLKERKFLRRLKDV